MYNVLISLGLGALSFSILYFTHLLRLGESIVPAVIVILASFFVMGRRTFKRVEAIFEEASKELRNQRFDAAVALLKSAYIYAPWQIGVRTQIDSQVGIIHYLRKDFNGAIPYLQRSQRFGHWLSAAMLAVAYYKKKDHKRMNDTFELVVGRAKKQGLVWNLYAYCLTQIGQEQAAQKVLSRGDAATKGDKRVRENLLAVQNGKKIKMRGYAEQWYQFHLDAPPQQLADGRSMFSARRRR